LHDLSDSGSDALGLPEPACCGAAPDRAGLREREALAVTTCI